MAIPAKKAPPKKGPLRLVSEQTPPPGGPEFDADFVFIPDELLGAGVTWQGLGAAVTWQGLGAAGVLAQTFQAGVLNQTALQALTPNAGFILKMAPPTLSTTRTLSGEVAEIRSELEKIREVLQTLAKQVVEQNERIEALEKPDRLGQSEGWAFKDQRVAAMIFRGLQEAAEGKGEVESFAQYADEE